MPPKFRRRSLHVFVLLALVMSFGALIYGLGTDVCQTRTLTTITGPHETREVTSTCRPAGILDPIVALPGLCAVLFSWGLAKRAARASGRSSRN